MAKKVEVTVELADGTTAVHVLDLLMGYGEDLETNEAERDNWASGVGIELILDQMHGEMGEGWFQWEVRVV